MNRTYGVVAGALSLIGAFAFAGCGEDEPPVEWDSIVDPTVAPADLNHENELIVYEATGRTRRILDVWVVDPETGDRARLTDGEGYNVGPAWSPDRERIVFASKRDGQEETDLYTMAKDGTDVERLTETDGPEYEPRYSPDGSTIAFAQQERGDWSLALIGADGSNVRKITPDMEFVEFPAWHPDGDYIIFAGLQGDTTTDIFGISPDGSDEVHPVIASDANELCPHFTPDGTMIFFARHAEGSDNIDIFARAADSKDLEGETAIQITDAPGRDDYGEPSPDGTQVVFASNRNGNFDLYTMNADGSNQTQLTDTPHIRENLPDW